MIKNKILAGTTKGLVVLEKKLKSWKIKEIHFDGLPVTIVYVDERTNSWWAGLDHRHWGQKLHVSNNEGEHWTEVATPKYPQNAEIKPGKLATLKKIWSISHAGTDKPGAMWLGTEPGGLFYREGVGEGRASSLGLFVNPFVDHFCHRFAPSATKANDLATMWAVFNVCHFLVALECLTDLRECFRGQAAAGAP